MSPATKTTHNCRRALPREDARHIITLQFTHSFGHEFPAGRQAYSMAQELPGNNGR